ncbi:MAG: type I 3-dehydroquinate dehydratase [Chlamydiae bacterium]|nr:MAG: type I 3-dehydroquinate dehydratase [Chlamydiota bacterium]
MLDINKSPFIVGVLNPKYFDKELEYLIEHQPDIIEYRADLADDLDVFLLKEDLIEINKKLNFPILFTLRDKSEGGKFAGSNAQRNEIYSAILELVDAIDIESLLAQFAYEIIKTAHAKGITVVLSYHNFEKTPGKSELETIIKKCFDNGADIAKIATMCETKNEAEQLISLTIKYENIAVVGMGKYGKITRITAPAFGSVLTYAFTDNKESPVPGQLTVEELKKAWELAGIIH